MGGGYSGTRCITCCTAFMRTGMCCPSKFEVTSIQSAFEAVVSSTHSVLPGPLAPDPLLDRPLNNSVIQCKHKFCNTPPVILSLPNISRPSSTDPPAVLVSLDAIINTPPYCCSWMVGASSVLACPSSHCIPARQFPSLCC